jgi:hypothetical protein
MGHGRLNSIHGSNLIPGIAFLPLNPSKNTGYVLSFVPIEANAYPKNHILCFTIQVGNVIKGLLVYLCQLF